MGRSVFVSKLCGFKLFVNQGVSYLMEGLVEVGSVCVINVLLFMAHQLGVGSHSTGFPINEGETLALL